MRLLAIILFAACGSRDAETTPAAEARPAENPGSAGANAEERLEAPQDPGPVPVIEMMAQSDIDDGLMLRLRVPGPEAVELRRRVRIERRQGDTWARVDVPYDLRTRCDAAESECITLAAGAELRSPGTAECGGAGLEAGEHRFVVESCAPDGARPHRVESEGVVESPRRP